MPFDPEDVLGAAGTDPGKGQQPSSGFDPLAVKAAMGYSQDRNLIAGTLDPKTNFADFRFQPKTNADNLLLRAQDQGFWESMGKTIGNTVANIPLDIIQGVGYLGTLFEMGDDRDYNNALTEAIEKLKNPAGEVYREHPEKVWDPADSAWWMNNLGQLVESSTSFALEGAGIAKLFGTVAKTAAWSAKSAKVGAKVAQGLSAGTLTYVEGAMSGARVFETAYNNNYMKMIGQGVDPSQADKQAKEIASQAAAATVQIHTAMNLGLNLTILAPMFRDPRQAVVQWWRRNGAQAPGESAAQWAERLAAVAPEGTSIRRLLGLGMQGPARLGLEALQEGLEEVNTQYAEHVGKDIGEGKEKKDVTSRLFDADRYFKEVLNEEGALNFVLGALGGLAQTAIMDNIPIHKIAKFGVDGKPLMTEEGTAQTERISTNTMNNRMNREYFDSIRDALSKDMTWFGEKNREMEAALRSGDQSALARARADLMSVHNLRAISMGLGDVWRNQYQDIMTLDNTRSLSEDLNPAIEQLDKQIEELNQDTGDESEMKERRAQQYELVKQRYALMQKQASLQDVTEAMQKGFSENKGDNTYRERAQQAINNLNYLKTLYQDMQDRYTGTTELDQSGLSEHMFYRQANLYLHKQQLDMMEQDLIKLRARIDEMTLTSQDDMLVRQAQQFLSDKEVLETTIKKLNNDITRLNEAVRTGNNTVFLKLLDKYKIPATEGAAGRLAETLGRRKTELQTRADHTTKELGETVAVWEQTNPDKKVSEVLQKASERPLLEDIYKQNKAYLQQGLTEYETAREQLAKDSTNESINRYIKENQPRSNRKQMDKEHIDAYNRQLDREIAATLDAKQKQEKTARLTERITELQKQLADKQADMQRLRRENNSMKGFFKNLSRRKTNRQAIEQLESDIYSLRFEISHLTRRRDAMASNAATATQSAQNVSRTPPPPIQPVDATTPASTPSTNTTEPAQGDMADFNEELPDFDFSSEITPAFTTIEEGNSVFDQLVGGNSSGTVLRQFIQLRKDSSPEFLVGTIRTMIERTGLPMPSQEEFDQFITPYVIALRNVFINQIQDPEQEYESIKSMLKPDILTVLDILEEEFRNQGFSYDRAIQVLNQQVQSKNLDKNLVGIIANRLKAYLESVEQPVQTDPVNVTPTAPAVEQQPATTNPVEQVFERLKDKLGIPAQFKDFKDILENYFSQDIATKDRLYHQTAEDIYLRVDELGKGANIQSARNLLDAMRYVMEDEQTTTSPQPDIQQTTEPGSDPVLGTPTITSIETGELYEFRTPLGLVAGIMKSDNEFQIDGITASEVGKGQGTILFEALINYLKDRHVSFLTTESAGEGAQRMHQKAVEKGLLKELGKDGRRARFLIEGGSTTPITNEESNIRREFNEEPTTYIQPITDSEPTTFSNAALELENVNRELKRFAGAQNIEVVKANFNTHPYTEFDNGTEIRIIANYKELDPKLNADVLLPGVINPGDHVTLVIDENWAGEINYDTEMIQDEFGEQIRKADMFQNYLDATGKIDTRITARHPKGGHANVPIKIIHQNTGKIIGYLPRADWILAKYPDTENYRNVIDEYQDENVTVTDNVARQYQRIIKLREAVVRSWNTDKSLVLSTVVSKRGTGHVMLNREVNLNTGRTKLVNRSAKNMLPDTSLEIAIMKQGTAYVGSGITSQKKINKLPGFLNDATSLPVVMLPSPDGTYVPTPLYTHRLGDNPGSINTIVSAITIYLRSAAGMTTDIKAIEKILEATGFDLRLPEGLRDFINQYFTYTEKFGEKDTVITPSEGVAKLKPGQKLIPKTVLDIPNLLPGERAAFIKIGTTYSGEKPIYAQLVDGQLHPDFESELKNYMADRFRSVIFSGGGLRGVNSQGEFKVPLIKKDGTVQINTFTNYNEYVKSISTTYVYGLNKVGNQYVYMANPVIQLDYAGALRSASPAPSTSLSQPSQVPQTEDQESLQDDELADLFGNGMLSPSPSSVTPLAIPSEGEQVSLEFLQELRNLTPEAHRNSKSPEQVLRELLERGITVLAEGHNPFYIC